MEFQIDTSPNPQNSQSIYGLRAASPFVQTMSETFQDSAKNSSVFFLNFIIIIIIFTLHYCIDFAIHQHKNPLGNSYSLF